MTTSLFGPVRISEYSWAPALSVRPILVRETAVLDKRLPVSIGDFAAAIRRHVRVNCVGLAKFLVGLYALGYRVILALRCFTPKVLGVDFGILGIRLRPNGAGFFFLRREGSVASLLADIGGTAPIAFHASAAAQQHGDDHNDDEDDNDGDHKDDRLSGSHIQPSLLAYSG
jgi:hypothetical protein